MILVYFSNELISELEAFTLRKRDLVRDETWIRKRIKLPAEKAIFIFVNDTLPPTAALMSAIYQEHKDKDGFLYVTYSGENTFGNE